MDVAWGELDFLVIDSNKQKNQFTWDWSGGRGRGGVVGIGFIVCSQVLVQQNQLFRATKDGSAWMCQR